MEVVSDTSMGLEHDSHGSSTLEFEYLRWSLPVAIWTLIYYRSGCVRARVPKYWKFNFILVDPHHD
jgi:hypothetical protein